jgi:hypothetical protein
MAAGRNQARPSKEAQQMQTPKPTWQALALTLATAAAPPGRSED